MTSTKAAMKTSQSAAMKPGMKEVKPGGYSVNGAMGSQKQTVIAKAGLSDTKSGSGYKAGAMMATPKQANSKL